MKRPGRLLILGTFLLLTSIWGTTWAAIRVGLKGIPPFTGVALRFAVAAAVLFSLVPVFRVRFTWTRRETGLWATNGLLSFCISYGIVYWAEQWIPSGLTAVLFSTFPLFVAALAHFFLPGERLTAGSAAGMLLGFAGVAVIFSEDFSLLGGGRVAFAAAVMLISPLVSAMASVAIKRWGAGIHPISLTVVPMALAAAIMGATAAVLERGREIVLDLPSVGALLYLAILGSAVTFTLYYWLMSHTTATGVSLIAYLVPVVAVFVGTVFMDEPLRLRIVIGAALVIVGVVWVGRFQSRRVPPLAPRPAPDR